MEKNENWFDKFRLSFSPFGNLIAIANKYNVVICKSKWGANNQSKFEISSRIEINENDKYVVLSIALFWV